jgi:hypothetical protein
MVKKLLVIVILLPFLFIMGCEMSGVDDIVYETPDAALIFSYYAAYNVTTEAFEAVIDSADENTGIIYFSNPECTINGTVSVATDGLNTIKTYTATIFYSDFSFDLYFNGGITGTINFSFISTTNEVGTPVGRSYTVTGKVNVSGLENLPTMELDIAGNLISEEATGEVNIDGIYYHLLDFDISTNIIIGIWIQRFSDVNGDWRNTYVMCDDGTYYYVSLLDASTDFEENGTFTYTDTTFQLTGDISGGTGDIPYTVDLEYLTFNGQTWSRQ